MLAVLEVKIYFPSQCLKVIVQEPLDINFPASGLLREPVCLEVKPKSNFVNFLQENDCLNNCGPVCFFRYCRARGKIIRLCNLCHIFMNCILVSSTLIPENRSYKKAPLVLFYVGKCL